jgi:adenylate cyclase
LPFRGHRRMERRLAAIVCADVAGYSRMMGADEAGTHAAFKAHRSAIYPIILNQAAGF